MSLHEGPIGPEPSVPLAVSSSSVPSTVVTTSSQSKAFPLPVASPPKVSSVPASTIPLAAPLAVLSQAASPSDYI